MKANMNQFWRDGFAHVPKVFSPVFIDELRDDVYRTMGEDRKMGEEFLGGELLSHPKLRRVLFEEKLYEIARTLLESTPIYFGDSGVNVGTGQRGWHRDNRIPDRWVQTAEDWNGRYNLIRFGIYLQDHSKYSGGLGVRIGSHEVSPALRWLDGKGFNRISRSLQLSTAYGKAFAVPTVPGDVVVWNLRTAHTGNTVRLRGIPSVKPWVPIENNAPSFVRMDENKERVALFITLAAEGRHLNSYIDYLRTRDYGRELLNNFHPSEESIEGLKKMDVKLMIPDLNSENF